MGEQKWSGVRKIKNGQSSIARLETMNNVWGICFVA